MVRHDPVLDESLDRRRARHRRVRLHERIAERLRPLLALLHRQFLDDDLLRRAQRRWNLVENFVDHVKVLVAKHFAHWRRNAPYRQIEHLLDRLRRHLVARLVYAGVAAPRGSPLVNRVRAGQFVEISPRSELVGDCTCFLQALDHDAAQAQSAVPTAFSVITLYFLGSKFNLGDDLALHVQRHQPSAFKAG